jgi:hypothetical protein
MVVVVVVVVVAVVVVVVVVVVLLASLVMLHSKLRLSSKQCVLLSCLRHPSRAGRPTNRALRFP